MDNEQKKKNSDAKIRANAKYNKKNYKNLSIKIRPDQAEKIRDTAQRHHLSLAQLIVQSVTEYDINHQPQQESQPQHQQEQQGHRQQESQTPPATPYN